MAMMTSGKAGTSSYNNRPVTIEVTGICQQAVMKTSNYRITVPFSQMSKAVQNITRMGGKIANIQVGTSPAAEPTATTET